MDIYKDDKGNETRDFYLLANPTYNVVKIIDGNLIGSRALWNRCVEKGLIKKNSQNRNVAFYRAPFKKQTNDENNNSNSGRVTAIRLNIDHYIENNKSDSIITPVSISYPKYIYLEELGVS